MVGLVFDVGIRGVWKLTIGYPWKLAGRCTTWTTFNPYAVVATSPRHAVNSEGGKRTRKWQIGDGILRVLTRLTRHNNHI